MAFIFIELSAREREMTNLKIFNFMRFDLRHSLTCDFSLARLMKIFVDFFFLVGKTEQLPCAVLSWNFPFSLVLSNFFLYLHFHNTRFSAHTAERKNGNFPKKRKPENIFQMTASVFACVYTTLDAFSFLSLKYNNFSERGKTEI